MRPFFCPNFEVLMKVRILFLAVLVSALAACGNPNDPGVGGVTRAEAEQLNEAAEALNQDKPPPSLATDTGSEAPLPPAREN
jgi:hypothetical protein